MKKTPLLFILGTVLISLVSCNQEETKTIYFTATGWFNEDAPTLNIRRYTSDNKTYDPSEYGTLMTHHKYLPDIDLNVWKFEVNPSKVSKVQFFRTWDEGKEDGNARTNILELPDFKTNNGFKVTSEYTWYNGSVFTEVEPILYKDGDVKPLPLVDEEYPKEILVPEIKEEQAKGKKIKEDLVTINKPNDNYGNYYEIYVGSYYDTNNDGVGDLNGVTKKLDYIKNSGFTGIWLMPIFSSPTYHKYDALDYYTIDPEYGTMEDLDNLIKEAHKKGLKIILDMVVNHCSDKSEIFKKSADCYEKFINNEKLGEKEQVYKDYFAFSKVDASTQNRKFYQVPGKNFFVEGNFPGGMCEWNLASPHTKKYFEEIYKFYIDKGVDGFRLDAVKYYFKEDDSKSIAYLNELNDYCKSINPNFYLVGECWDIDENKVTNYYTSRIDSYFNFKTSSSTVNNYIRSSLYNDGWKKYVYYNGFIESEKQANIHIPAVFLDNHDMPRIGMTDLPVLKFQYALLAMHKGNTFTYYGSEIGLDGTNKNGDENVRTYMNWSDENKGGMTLNPHKTRRNEYLNPPLNKQLNDPYSVYNFYKKVNLLRNQIPAIARGDFLETSEFNKKERPFRIDKQYGETKIGIIINFSEYDYLEYDYSKTNYTDVIGQITAKEETYIGDLGNNKLSIPPLGIAIMK